jgi:hypothetical protein
MIFFTIACALLTLAWVVVYALCNVVMPSFAQIQPAHKKACSCAFQASSVRDPAELFHETCVSNGASAKLSHWFIKLCQYERFRSPPQWYVVANWSKAFFLCLHCLSLSWWYYSILHYRCVLEPLGLQLVCA